MLTRFRWLVLALCLISLPACATANLPPPPPSAAIFTVPALTPTPQTTPAAGLKMTRGVFIVTTHNVAIQPATYTNPAVDGIVIRTFWSNVQPAPDRFDWSFIDSQVQAASASGKKVILVVLPGAFTPQWALQGVQSAQFVVDYGFMQGTDRYASDALGCDLPQPLVRVRACPWTAL